MPGCGRLSCHDGVSFRRVKPRIKQELYEVREVRPVFAELEAILSTLNTFSLQENLSRSPSLTTAFSAKWLVLGGKDQPCWLLLWLFDRRECCRVFSRFVSHGVFQSYQGRIIVLSAFWFAGSYCNL